MLFVIIVRIIGFVWYVGLLDVGDMSLERDMLDDIGRKVGMCWLWSWKLSGYGIIRVISESLFSGRGDIPHYETES